MKKQIKCFSIIILLSSIVLSIGGCGFDWIFDETCDGTCYDGPQDGKIVRYGMVFRAPLCDTGDYDATQCLAIPPSCQWNIIYDSDGIPVDFENDTCNFRGNAACFKGVVEICEPKEAGLDSTNEWRGVALYYASTCIETEEEPCPKFYSEEFYTNVDNEIIRLSDPQQCDLSGVPLQLHAQTVFVHNTGIECGGYSQPKREIIGFLSKNVRPEYFGLSEISSGVV